VALMQEKSDVWMIASTSGICTCVQTISKLQRHADFSCYMIT